MEIRTAFGAIYALYPVLARVQAEIARNSNAIETSLGSTEQAQELFKRENVKNVSDAPIVKAKRLDSRTAGRF